MRPSSPSQHSSIETIYTSTTTTSTSSNNSVVDHPRMDESNTTHQTTTSKQLLHLMAALSFEKPSFVPKVLQKRKKKKKKKKTAPQRPQDVVVVVVAEDSDHSGDDDVFFDAVQYNTTTPATRESIVLAGIAADTGDGEIEIVLDPSDQHSDTSSSAGDTTTTGNNNNSGDTTCRPLPPPAPPTALPLRFLRAGKNDPTLGRQRYQATLAWRREQGVDTILREAFPHFTTIKHYYPHYCHLRGRQHEPCFYEKPAQTNLKALKHAGVTLATLLRHYTLVAEYQWQYLERDDMMRSIYMIDLQGIRLLDFAGEAVEFLQTAASLASQHYPERAGCVFVLNVPAWFKMIWSAVSNIVDESTLSKIFILRGVDEMRRVLQEKIPLENIPPEYGGTSMPLGESPEEQILAEWMEHNNRLQQQGRQVCEACETCRFCQWVPARSY